MEIKNLNSISMKDSKEINENMIQEYIFNNPSVLKLGELSPIRREKIQPHGGRLDLLLSDENTRYEVEIQLGKTDESHIIRTIEYWDTERKRYPQYDHCAVIIAEEITRRFMNVISLFNGAIPLIAIQMSAHKIGNETYLYFTKVLDRVTLGEDEEDQLEVADRPYWEAKSTKKIMTEIDKIFESLGEYADGYSLKYNKHFIGIAHDGIARNFVHFIPRKSYLYMEFKGDYDDELINEGDSLGVEINYDTRWKQYEAKINSFDEYQKNVEYFTKLVIRARDYYNL